MNQVKLKWGYYNSSLILEHFGPTSFPLRKQLKLIFIPSLQLRTVYHALPRRIAVISSF
jgi:hypothetical protein